MKTYTIKEISTMFGLPASTLRYYEEIGLLVHVEHTASNKRVYTQEHIDRLNAIQCFKQTGLPLNKMLLFFEYEKNLPSSIDDIIDLVKTQEQDIRDRMQELADGLCHIQDKVRYYTEIRKAIDENRPWPTWGECLDENRKGIMEECK